MGFHGNDETRAYCPFCKKTTDQWIEWEDDYRAQSCSVCESEQPNDVHDSFEEVDEE